MDDFGTGYSSLSYLRSFPFDKVKIDRSFIKDLPNDKNAMAIIRAIVGLGETFGMTVTAEGVETNEQAVLLALEDCTHLQGYLFSKAVPAGDIPTLIEHFSGSSSRGRRLTTSRRARCSGMLLRRPPFAPAAGRSPSRRPAPCKVRRDSKTPSSCCWQAAAQRQEGWFALPAPSGSLPRPAGIGSAQDPSPPVLRHRPDQFIAP